MELKQNAKQTLKGKWDIAIGSFLAVAVISIVFNLIPFVNFISSIIIVPPLTIGLYMTYFEIIKGNSVSVSYVFKGFNITLRSAWLQIITSFFILLWMLLFIIPGIIKSLSYAMAPFILAENNNLTALEALNESKIIMEGHKADLFVLYLSFIGWAILSAITFGIALLYVGPYMTVTMMNFYNEIKRSSIDYKEE